VGAGIDSLIAGIGEDMLIAGRIFYNWIADDADFVSALKVLWHQSLPAATRIAAVTALVSSTAAIQTDLQADQLQSDGDASIDLLFASLGDIITRDAADFLSL
jgi:hypothetical protein